MSTLNRWGTFLSDRYAREPFHNQLIKQLKRSQEDFDRLAAEDKNVPYYQWVNAQAQGRIYGEMFRMREKTRDGEWT